MQGLVKLKIIMFKTDPGNAQKPYLGSYFIWIDPQKVLCQVPSAFWEMVPNFFFGIPEEMCKTYSIQFVSY